MATTQHTEPLLPGSAVGPPEALYHQIRARVAATSVSTTRTRVRIFAALVAIPVLTAIVVAIASEFVYGRQAVGLEVGRESTARLLLMSCLLAGLACISTVLALWRGSRGWGAGAVSLALTAGLVAPIYGALVLPSPLHLHDAGVPWVEISPWGLRCFVIAAVVGFAVMASLALALRRAVAAAGRLRGAVLGAAAGAWAGLAVFIFCPSGDPLHLLLGHVLPIVGLTLLGGFALSRTLRP